MSTDRLRDAPASRFDRDSVVFDLPAELTRLRAEGPAVHGHRQKTLFKHAGSTIALFAFDAGGRLPDHEAAGTVTVQVVEGEIVLTVNETRHQLRRDQVLVLAPGVRHAVLAERAAAFLLHVSLTGS